MFARRLLTRSLGLSSSRIGGFKLPRSLGASSSWRVLTTSSRAALRPARLTRPTTSTAPPRRTFNSFSSSSSSSSSNRVPIRLRQLEADADRYPRNAHKQVEFARELSRHGLDRVIVLRYESRRFARSHELHEEYMRACDRLGHRGAASAGMAPRPATSYYSLESQGAAYNSYAPALGASGALSAAPSSELGAQALEQAAALSKKHPFRVRIVEEDKGPLGARILSGLADMGVRILTLCAVFYAVFWMLGRSQGGNANPLSMSKAPSYQKYMPNEDGISFDDVCGVEEAKEELMEIVDFLRNPEKYNRLGGKLPRGVLLTGPPGTGKTLLAKAVAAEANVPFYFTSGAEFEEMFVGLGAKRVRSLFAAAREDQPCLVFIDEIDAIGGTRRAKQQQALRMTLNQLLVELDGFAASDGIVVIGATNFPQMLDKALVRPGRFDKHVTVPLPDVRGREAILKLYLNKVKRIEEIDARTLARGTPGCTGAMLANLINTAAVRAAQLGFEGVNNETLEWAKDKILMGAERKSAVMSEENRKLTAYHEGGHAIVALMTDGAMPIHKATIMPRGQALGMVSQLPEDDMLNHTKHQLLAMLDVCMGGRVAEEIIFGAEHVTTGASSDLQKATQIARSMVMQYGMSDKVGRIEVSENDLPKLGPKLRTMIDEEVRSLLDSSYERARSVLVGNEDRLHQVAKALLDKETLTRDQLLEIVGSRPSPTAAN